MVFGQADMGTVETATKLFGPMGGVCAVLVAALVYVFRLYHAETRARIEDARAFADAQRAVNEQILPYVAKIVRRVERLSPVEGESDPPPALSVRAARFDIEVDTQRRSKP